MNEIWSRPPEPLRPHYFKQGEPEVVPTYQLAVVIREWSLRFLADRPRDQWQTGKTFVDSGMPEFMGPVDWLTKETGIDQRQISRITTEETVTTSLTVAEKLLMAIDREYMLANGEIQVVPNPSWSLDQWMSYMRERGC